MWALIALSVVAPQLLGGATPRTAFAILILSCVVCSVVAFAVHAIGPLGRVPLAGLAGFIATGWTLVQLLRVPCRWLDPTRTRALDEIAALAGLDAPQCTLSWAPGSTRISLAIVATLTALLLASVALSRAGQRDLLIRGIALSSVAMAIVALAHTTVRAEQVFGWYTPQHARPPLLLAPLLNANHLAGHLALGFPICLALGLRTKRLDARIAWLGLAFLVLTCGLLSLSRGGALALGAGGGGYLVVYLRRQHKEGRTASRSLVLGLAGAVAMATLAMYVAGDLVAKEFVEGDATEKVAALRNFIPLLREHPVAGVGRGALADASARALPGHMRVAFAENLPLHWALEWGIPVAVVLLALVLASIANTRPRTMQWAVLCGLLALGGQNLVDYSLELVGVATVATVALGTLLTQRAGIRPARYWLPRPPLRAACFVATGVALCSLIAAAGALTVASRPKLKADLQATLAGDSSDFQKTQQTALQLYPLDPFFILIGAARAVRVDDRSALRWLNLAMDAAPRWAGAHVQAAYYLERRGRLLQAALEIRLSFERNVAETWAIADGFLKRHPRAHFAQEMLPDRSEHRQWIAESLASALFVAAPPVETERFVAYVQALFPASAVAHRYAVELALRSGNVDLALARAHAMQAKCPESARSVAAIIKVLVQAGRPEEALRVYDSSPSKSQGDREVLLEALAAAGAARDATRINALADELFARYGGSAEMRGGLHWRASVQFERAGELGQALSHAQKAYEVTHQLGNLERVHALAVRAGIAQVALRAATELCHLGYRRDMYCRHPAPP